MSVISTWLADGPTSHVIQFGWAVGTTFIPWCSDEMLRFYHREMDATPTQSSLAEQATFPSRADYCTASARPAASRTAHSAKNLSPRPHPPQSS